MKYLISPQVYWAKGDAMIRRSSGGHKRAPSVGSFADTSATVTKKGSLRIKRLTFADAGMYTCLGELPLQTQDNSCIDTRNLSQVRLFSDAFGTG